MKKVLVIVDPQNDFITGNLSVVGAREAIQAIIAEIMWEVYDEIFVTLDFHPIDHCSFKVNGGEWPSHCIEYTWGSAIPANLSAALIATARDKKTKIHFITKGTFRDKEEYGAFGDSLPLPKFMLDFSTKDACSITVCGIAGDYCVLETTSNILKMGKENITMYLTGIASIDGGAKLSEFIEENNLKVKEDNK